MEINRVIKFGLVLMILFLSFCGTEEVRETPVEKNSNVASKETEKNDRLKKIEDLSKKIGTEKNNAELYNERGNLKSDNEDFKGAIEDFTTAISINPKFANAFYNRARAKENLENRKQAIEDFNKAISINPNDADFYYGRGLSKSELKDNKGAIEDYSKAISLNPKDGVAFRARAFVKIELGDFDGAKEDFEFALKNEGITQNEIDQAMNLIIQKKMLWSVEKKDIDSEELILDSQIEDFKNAWFNSKENPNIENSVIYSKDEFEYNKDKSSFAKIREQKYVITDTFAIKGEYDFKKSGYNVRSGGAPFNTLPDKSETTFAGINFNIVDRLYKIKNPITIEDYFKTTVLFKIPEEEAKDKNKKIGKVYILSKISPASHTSPAQCVFPKDYYEQRDNEFRECERKYKNKKSVTYKYFKIEPLRYHIEYNGIIYKNY